MELNNLDEAHVKKLFDRIQFVQCPICLDVIQNIRELPCRHSFCAVCLETYKEGKDVFACPLCKREVPKRKFLIRDSARDSLCVFMKKLCDDFKGHYGADIVSFFKSFDNRNLKQTSEEIIQPSSEENIIPCTAIQSTNKQTSKRKSVDNKRTKSGSNLRTAKKPKQLEITKNLLSRDNSKTLPGIVATSTVKPELKNKKNKFEKSPRPKLKELHLESTENKTKILQWLHDTKNKFDRLSQTQNAVEVDCRDYTDQQMLSQNSFHESNKNNENDQNCGNEKLEVQHIGKKRARSVENSERECEEFKRHTLECSSPSKFKHYQIQKGKESMEDKLRKKVINIVEDEVLDEFDKEVSGEIKMPNLDLVDTFRAKQVIEDEFLNKLDDKISQNVVKNLSTFSNNKTKTKINHKHSKFSWKNISKFKRSIKKSNVPKKLDISLQPTQKQTGNSKSDTKSVTNDTFGNKLSSNTETKSINIQEMEAYFSKAIPEMIKNNIHTTSEEISGDFEMDKFEQPKVIENTSEDINKSISKKWEPSGNNNQEFDGSSSDIYIFQTQPLAKNLDVSRLDEAEYAIKLATKLKNLVSPQEKQTNFDAETFSSILAIIENISHLIHQQKAEINSNNFGNSQRIPDRIRQTSFCEKEIQTDVFSLDGFNITSTAAFISSTHEDASTQTEKFCKNCPHMESSDSIIMNRDQVFTSQGSKQIIESTHDTINTMRNTSPYQDTIVPPELKRRNSKSIGIATTLSLTQGGTMSKSQSQTFSKEKDSNLLDEPKFNEKVPNVSKENLMESEIPIDVILEQCNQQSEPGSMHVSENHLSQSGKMEDTCGNGKVSAPTQGSDIIYSPCSFKSKVNQRLIFEKAMKVRSELESTLKRARATNSNSGSDEERPNKVACNRFIQDDLSIEFETQSIQDSVGNKEIVTNGDHVEKVPTTTNKMSVVTTQNNKVTEEFNIRTLNTVGHTQTEALLSYCDQLIEKANKQIFNEEKLSNLDLVPNQIPSMSSGNENLEFTKSTKKTLPKESPEEESYQPNNQMKTQDLLRHCDELIEKANEQIGIRKYNSPVVDNKKTKYSGYSQIATTSKYMVEIQDVRLPEKSNELRTQDLLDHCNALIEKTTNHTDLGKNKLPKNTEGKKIESQIEDEFFCQNLDQLEIVLERVNENTDIISKTIIEEPLVRTEDGDIKDKQKNEIETMDLLTYSTPKRANRDYYNEPNSKKIKISQNLSIARNDKSKMSQVDEITSSDDELFSDLDVVETTPPKVKRSFFERLSCSQTLTHNPTKLTKLVEIDDDSQLNLDFLPPPPGFEDEEDNEEKSDYVTPTEDIQPVTQKESENIIPNSLSPQGIQMVQIKKPLRMKHSSTPRTLSQEFPGLSPISQVKNTNVIEMAHQSKFSPLTVLPKASPLPSPLTSTPKQKSILSFLEPTKKLSLNNIVDNAQSKVSKPKPCIAYSRLKKEEILGIISLCNRKLATRKDKFEPDVTHMIVSVDKNNKLKDHTMKFVSAVAGGVWVVNYKWVKECLAQNTIVNEEQYEVLDASGIPSPRISRLSREKNPLFQGFKFFIAKPFTQTSVQEIEVAIRLLSGTIASSIEDLVDKDKFICIIIAEVSSTEDLYKCESWLETYKVATVDFHWLSLSISRYRLLSLKPYAICGDDCLEDLGYPSALTEDVPSSLTDDTYHN